ncbi:hypothetical protein A2W24_02675 [Microgenomates group bacterium RBG_16_45_19]|nr:MAG: hypothetical protein A2W24_02675 [Microgenomates group bacterium RBG_16_45_19]
MSQISDDYLIGFIEGEGCFYVSFVPSKETKSRWQLIYFFKVSQNPRGIEVLEALKNRLECGYIKHNASATSSDKSLAYVVRNIRDIKEKVIPFFNEKLIIKREDFKKFCQVIQLVLEKKHLTREGVEEIISITNTMNTGKRKYHAHRILRDYTSEKH